MHIAYMGEESGRGSGRVGSDQTFCRQLRVGSGRSGRVNVSPGRVGSKKSNPWTTLGRTEICNYELIKLW